MFFQTKILYRTWIQNVEPTSPKFDRLKAPHGPARDKMISLISRGKMNRYRLPGDVIFEETPEYNSKTMLWGSREVAQEWLDFASTDRGFISGEITEIV